MNKEELETLEEVARLNTGADIEALKHLISEYKRLSNGESKTRKKLDTMTRKRNEFKSDATYFNIQIDILKIVLDYFR